MNLLFVALASLLVSCSSIETNHSLSGAESKPSPPSRRSAPAKAQLPPAEPDVYYKTGLQAFQAKDYQKAFDYFIAAESKLTGQKKFDAQWAAFRTGLRAHRWAEAHEMAEKILSDQSFTVAQLLELYHGKVQALESLGDFKGALGEIQIALLRPELKKDHEGFRSKGDEIIETHIPAEQLEGLAHDLTDRHLRAVCYNRLAEITLEGKDLDSARRYYAKVINEDFSSDIGRQAQEHLSQLEAVKRVEPKTIGVVLPLTGRHASIAQKTLRGIQMGLGLPSSSTPFKIAVVDSEGNPDIARRGVERLVTEDNVIAVIGSLLSKTAPGVATKTSELGVPSIALSQKSGITEAGPTVFRNALTSEMLVRQLVKTAREDLGLKRFAILYPNDLYGVEFANIFWDEVLARGGSITAAQSYSPKETDFRIMIQRLVGTYYIDDRAEEYKHRLKEWTQAQNAKRADKSSPPEDLLPPLVDFDAIFIPDSAKAMGQIAAMLTYNNVRGVKLLGTNLWNVPGLAKRAGSWASQLLFVDSLTGEATTVAKSNFEADYKGLFGEEPGVFELQGYDSGLILRQLISQGASSREALTASLTQLKELPGAIGPLTMSPEREVRRPVVPLILRDGQLSPYLVH